MTPLLLTVHLLGVLEVKEKTPSPLPPPAVACAISAVVMLDFEISKVTSALCCESTPKKLCAFATLVNWATKKLPTNIDEVIIPTQMNRLTRLIIINYRFF
jgi:hypothetical protein